MKARVVKLLSKIGSNWEFWKGQWEQKNSLEIIPPLGPKFVYGGKTCRHPRPVLLLSPASATVGDWMLIVSNLLWLVAFLVLPIWALPQTFSHGTSIAVIRTNKEIVIATDSRVVTANKRRQPDTCKIRSSGKWRFTMSGTISTPGIDAASIVAKALRDQGTIADKFTSIIDLLMPRFASAIKSDPKLREYAAREGAVLGIVVVGIEGGVLKLMSVSFQFRNGVVSPEIRTCPGDCYIDGRAGVFAPYADRSKFNWNEDPLTAAREFVQMEIDRDPVGIGPPIQILQINDTGHAKWINKPDVCKDQK